MTFFDAVCSACKGPLRWAGELTQPPACPRCGHRMTDDFKSDQTHIDEFRELLRQRGRSRRQREDRGHG